MVMQATPMDEGMAAAVALAVEGDEAAFARIVQRHHDDMSRVSFIICGSIDLAEEAVQSAWSIAWRKLGSLRDPERLRQWLVSLAANETRQLVRRRRRREVIEPEVAISAGTPEDPDARTTDLDLANALARLDPRDRALLALRYVAGFDATELSRATGLSPSGTRARLARLLERLRMELRDA